MHTWSPSCICFVRLCRGVAATKSPKPNITHTHTHTNTYLKPFLHMFWQTEQRCRCTEITEAKYYTYTHTHTRIHTHTHTHTHKYIPEALLAYVLTDCAEVSLHRNHPVWIHLCVHACIMYVCNDVGMSPYIHAYMTWTHTSMFEQLAWIYPCVYTNMKNTPIYIHTHALFWPSIWGIHVCVYAECLNTKQTQICMYYVHTYIYT